MPKAGRAVTSQAWWSEPGPDLCEFCLHAFHVEAGYYCADCDRPVCPSCIFVRREQQLVLCPHCAEGAEV